MKTPLSITVFITCLLTLACISLWGTGMPIQISFSASSSSQSEITNPVNRLFYTTRKNKEFELLNSIETKTTPNKSQNFNFEIYERRVVKVKMLFNKTPEKVKISNLLVQGLWDISLEDIDKITPEQMDFFKLSPTEIILSSTQKSPALIIELEPRIYLGLSVNPLLLISIIALLFLFVYQVILFLVGLKVQEKCSIVTLIFLGIFFSILFIPMLNINKDTISKKENRNLAPYKPFFSDGKLNSKFGTDFESWFNDRFLGRKQFIGIYNFFNRQIPGAFTSVNLIFGDNNWLFYKPDNGIGNFENKDMLSTYQLEALANYLSSIDTWCKQHGKEFYYVIAPDKNKIYGEYFPGIYKKHRPDSEGRAMQAIEYLRKNTKVKALYLYDAMHKNKGKDLLYYKTDTHWTKLGAYYAYKEIMKMVDQKNEIPTFKATDMIAEEVRQGDLIGLNDSGRNLPDDMTSYKFPKLISDFVPKEGKLVQFYINKDGNKNIFLLRDSFSIALLPYLGESFKEVAYVGRHNLTKEDLEYIQKNSDVVVLEHVERYLPNISSLEFPKE